MTNVRSFTIDLTSWCSRLPYGAAAMDRQKRATQSKADKAQVKCCVETKYVVGLLIALRCFVHSACFLSKLHTATQSARMSFGLAWGCDPPLPQPLLTKAAMCQRKRFTRRAAAARSGRLGRVSSSARQFRKWPASAMESCGQRLRACLWSPSDA